ncbi:MULTISPECIES: hypothetical protein [Rhizobium]|nr:MULTISPECIES: hypothetical protein [Rhizobium]WSH11754.1 hypothetical protein U8P72_29915 [Rhizobium johnstonii]MBY5378718.1 hypothetical protein [Rhizobium leguminosarum]MBY5391355.1 hypothetical protein [Rhizobium leguminosarum]MBY5433804.1 hypothetical protein [Rhizobium leguminosarum]NEI95857.1 hypothetical protein [Rhizobium leguminosarum]
MGLGSILRYAQLLVVAILVAANPSDVAATPSTLQSQHCAVVERDHHLGHTYDPQTGCCSTMHCCPILPELAKVAAPRFEPGRHEPPPSVERPLLLIRAIDPPPRFPPV